MNYLSQLGPKVVRIPRPNGIILYLAENFFFYILGRFFFPFQFASRSLSLSSNNIFPCCTSNEEKKMGNIFDMTTLSHIYNISSSHGARKMDVNNLAPSFSSKESRVDVKIKKKENVFTYFIYYPRNERVQ